MEKEVAQTPAAAANVPEVIGTSTKAVDRQPLPRSNYPVANYYALIIGNGNYANMGGLPTPTQDAQSISELLSSRYGFKTDLLLDATANKIMAALNKLSREINESDRLLIITRVMEMPAAGRLSGRIGSARKPIPTDRIRGYPLKSSATRSIR